MRRRNYDFGEESEKININSEDFDERRGLKPATIIIVIICAILAGYIATLFFTKILSGRGDDISITKVFSKNPFGDREYVRILFLGVDNSDKNGNGLSDTIVLFTINTKTKEARALTFPRDTYIENGGIGHKLNSAHRNGGPENVVKVLEENFIYPDMIDYYVKTTTKGLREMVDLLDGVYILVDQNMYYNDNYGNLHIDLKAKPEKQLLNGHDAEGFVRFRKDKFGDTGYKFVDGEKVSAGRTARQQKFMIALCNRVISLPSKFERAKFLKTCYDKGYIESNLKLTDWDALADFMLEMKPEEMYMEVLPGEGKMISGASYWQADPEKSVEMINKIVRFEGPNPNKPQEIVLDANGNPVVGEPAKAAADTEIKILNGSGIKGLAAKVGQIIGASGYTNFTTDNADNFDYVETVIKCKDQSTGFVLKNIMGCGKVVLDSFQSKDVIITVGKDMDKSDENQ